MPKPRLGPWRIGAFTVSHLINDSYPNLYPILLPELMPILHFGTAGAGFINTVSALTTQLLQPFMGFVADRTGGRAFVVGGLALGSFVSALALGLAPSYPLLLLMLLVGGLGNSAFHPHASSIVGEATGQQHKGLGMSFFMVGGNLGRAIAPVMAGAAYVFGGRKGILAVAIPGLVMAFVMTFVMTPPPEPRRGHAQRLLTPDFYRGLGEAGSLLAVVGLRSMAASTAMTLVPIWWKLSGRPLAETAGLLSLFFVAGSIGNMIGGLSSDYLGMKPVLIASAVLSSLFFTLFLSVRNPILDFVLFGFLGAALYSTGSVVMVFSQALFPKNRGMASGLTLGLGNTLGSLGVAVMGLIADFSTPSLALWVTTGAVLLSIPFVLRLKNRPIGVESPQ